VKCYRANGMYYVSFLSEAKDLTVEAWIVL
jgi:hypothetical protein